MGEDTHFRARVLGPSAWRHVGNYALPLPYLAGMLAFRFLFDVGPSGWLFLGGSIVSAALSTLCSRRSSREVDVVLGGGYVDITPVEGGLRRRLRGRKLRGATTATMGDSTVVSVGDARGTYTVECAAEDAHRMRSALGIGHHGFGRLRWMLGRDWLPLVGSLGVWMFALAKLSGPALAFGLFAWMIGALFVRATERGEGIALDGAGIMWPRGSVAYRDVKGARVEGDQLLVSAKNGVHPIGVGHLSAEEREHIAAQIGDAAMRAAGRVAPEPTVPEEIARLAEGEKDSAGWLAELDADAQRMLRTAGYRGANMTEAELWDVLENHDAAPDVRAAVARILARASSDPAKGDRIDRIAKSAREEKTEKLIRIAIRPDVNEAARELEAVREAELSEQAKRMRS